MLCESAKHELLNFGQRLSDAKHGEKKSIIAEALAYFGWPNHHKLYRELKSLGWSTGRKKRADAGKTGQDEEALLALAAMTKTSARANGKTLMETPNAISVLSQNGYQFKSPSTVNRLLRERSLTAEQMKQQTSHGNFKTEHPNQVHLVDPSLCVLYYPPGGKGVKIQRYTTVEEQYKNKPEQLEKIKNYRVWRYVMVDHYSGLVCVKYYESAGENQQILYDFLLWAWSKVSGSPFHGLPYNLYWDKGSANTSIGISNALDCLNVKPVAHKEHVARAKGAVEQANNLVEKLFEGRLLFEPVRSVEELNQAVEKWQNAYNANRVPGYNATHNRHGMSRQDAWLKIMQPTMVQHLRALPPMEYCRYAFTHKPVERKVSGNLEITLRHPVAKEKLTYSLEGIEGVSRNTKVIVSPIVEGNKGAVLVKVTYQGEVNMHEVAPVVFDDMGFRVDSPVFGQGFDVKQDSQVDKNQKALDRTAYPDLTDEQIDKAKKKKVTPFNGEIDAISHIKTIDEPAVITPKGEKFDVPTEFQPDQAKPLSRIAAKRLISTKLNRDLAPHEAELIANFGDIYDHDIATLVGQILNPEPQGLRLVSNQGK